MYLNAFLSSALPPPPSLPPSKEFDNCPCLHAYVPPDTDCAFVLRNGSCYPSEIATSRTYGMSGCRQYDILARSECRVADPPPSCFRSWCFVDPEHCARDNQESFVYFHPSVCVYDGGRDPLRGIDDTECVSYSPKLTYSYQTCGELDNLLAANMIRELAATRTLRLSFPADFTWRIYSVNATEGPGGGMYGSGRRGVYPEFMLNELTSHGISFTFVPISQKSREATVSSYTACARDVALNNTDLCVAGTWLTVERLGMTTFTNNLDTDTFLLLGPNSGGDDGFKFDLWESLKIALSPIHYDAWIALLLAFAFFGVCLWLVSEDEEAGFDHEYDIRARAGRVFHAQAISTLAFTGTLPDLNRKPSFQWLAIAGLSFSAMIVNSYYTSGITASRFFQAIDNQGVSITEVIAGQNKICGMAPVRAAFVFRFPDIERHNLWVTVSDMPELLQGMDEGNCSYAIFTPEWWEYIKAGYWELPHYDDVRRANTHCKNKVPIPLRQDQSVGMPVAMPVRREVQARSLRMLRAVICTCEATACAAL
mmetsp:Transcript_57430/g.170793  ORF Transcript_57430/g.170793 Transcript_57430/m.170793 type:complete len:538 (+) Transcript_57430:45-1658(+)